MRSRKANKYKKKKEKVHLIFVEGETEEKYLKYVKMLYRKSVLIRVIKKSRLKQNVKEFIQEYADTNSVDVNEIYLMYDLEQDPEEFKKFIQNNRLVHENIYLCQPCIEGHFLLHHEVINVSPQKYMTSADAVKKLKNECPNYRKGRDMDWNKAGINLKEVDLAKERSISLFSNIHQPYFSMVGKLIQDIFE